MNIAVSTAFSKMVSLDRDQLTAQSWARRAHYRVKKYVKADTQDWLDWQGIRDGHETRAESEGRIVLGCLQQQAGMRVDDISHAVCRQPGSRGRKKDLTMILEGVLKNVHTVNVRVLATDVPGAQAGAQDKGSKAR